MKFHKLLTRINGETFTGGGSTADDDILVGIYSYCFATMKQISIRKTSTMDVNEFDY